MLGRIVKNEISIKSYCVIHQIKAKICNSLHFIQWRYLYWYGKHSTFKNAGLKCFCPTMVDFKIRIKC